MSELQRAYGLLKAYVNREWDRIRGLELWEAQQELDAPAGTQPVATPEPKEPVDPKAHARRLLGVAENATFDEIQRAFHRLNKRSDPANFAEGSPEREAAEDIQKRVQWAYRQLAEEFDVSERRFRGLEIE